MSVQWMWGWELGTEFQSYGNSGWVIGANLNLTAPNIYGNIHHSNAFQPAAGYGGGQFCLALSAGGNGDQMNVRTPTSGPGSPGSHSQFIFHDAYKREGTCSHASWQRGALLGFYNGNTPALLVAQAASQLDSSAISLWMWDGATTLLLGTSTTTYTGNQPYHRIVVDADLSNPGVSTVTIYINGVLEIGPVATPAGMGFTTINNVEWHAGASYLISGGTGSGGGRHDHCVLWDAGNHATGDLIMANAPLNNETVIIGAQTYTFKSTLTPAANEVLIETGGTAPQNAIDSRRNLINAINLGPGSGTQYAAATTLNADVTAEEDLAIGEVHVVAKLKGVNVTATTDTLTQGSDGWLGAGLSGGDLDKTNDLALALGAIFIQGLLPNKDVVDGAFLNVNGAHDGTNVDMFANINDGQNLTDFIETVTSPDAVEFGVENRGDVSGTPATATLTLSGGSISTGEQVVVGSQTYTFTSPFVDSANNIDASVSDAQSLENLRRAITGAGLAGTNYGAGTPVNVDVTAVDTPTTVVVTAKRQGSPGNAIPTTTTGAFLSWGAGMAGGTENWLPSQVHAVQTVQVARASGAITSGRTTVDIPSLGKVTSDAVPLSSAGIIVPQLREWRTGNTTTDVDGIETGTEV